jgi:hypothetical protein
VFRLRMLTLLAPNVDVGIWNESLRLLCEGRGQPCAPTRVTGHAVSQSSRSSYIRCNAAWMGSTLRVWMQIVVSIVGILMMTAPAYYGSLSKNADKAPKAKPVIALTS